MPKTSAAAALIAALLAVALPSPASAAHTKYELGAYKGTTSQGSTFSVEIHQVGERYLLDMRGNGVKVSEPCAAGYANAVYMNVGPLSISPTGRVHTRTEDQGDVETTSFDIKHNRTLTGTVSETTPSDGCDSGTVHLTARR